MDLLIEKLASEMSSFYHLALNTQQYFIIWSSDNKLPLISTAYNV
jgi:hypothetical protein